MHGLTRTLRSLTKKLTALYPITKPKMKKNGRNRGIGNVSVSKKFFFILSVIPIISVRLLSYGTHVYHLSARADVTSV